MTTPDTNVGREQYVETLRQILAHEYEHTGAAYSMEREALKLAIATLRTPTSARGEEPEIYAGKKEALFKLWLGVPMEEVQMAYDQWQSAAVAQPKAAAGVVTDEMVRAAMDALDREHLRQLAADGHDQRPQDLEAQMRAALEAALVSTPQDQGRNDCPNCEGEYPDSCWYCDRERNTAPKAQEGGEDGLAVVVRDHIADLRRCVPVLRGYDNGAFQITATEFAKAANELEAALSSRPSARQPSGEVVAWTTPESLKMLRDPECGVGMMHCRRTDYISVPLYTPLDDAGEK